MCCNMINTLTSVKWQVTSCEGGCDNGSHTTSDTSGTLVAPSSDLSCGLGGVYHISWLFSMWLWLISDPHCCLVHRQGAGSRGGIRYLRVTTSPLLQLLFDACNGSTIPHISSISPSGMCRVLYIKGSKWRDLVWKINRPVKKVSFNITAQVWTISLYLTLKPQEQCLQVISTPSAKKDCDQLTFAEWKAAFICFTLLVTKNCSSSEES